MLSMRRLALLLLISTAFAQIKPAAPSASTLEIIPSENDSTLTLLSGELTVPAHATREFRFAADTPGKVEGWITSVRELSLHGGDGQESLVPHAQVINASRNDLLCKGRDEIIGQFGQHEQPMWPDLEEYGYHVRPGDRLGLILSFENRSDQPVQLKHVGVTVKFQPINEPPFRRDAYPLWFNSRGCGPAEFDLKPGKNIYSGTFEIPVTGTLVALQGALREHAEYLDVENRSREKSFLHQAWTGPAQPLPLVIPLPGEEFRVDQGDFVAIAAGYNNPDKNDAKAAGTGVALGLFIPVGDTKIAQFAKKQPPAEQ
jgi:hypothetical protein